MTSSAPPPHDGYPDAAEAGRIIALAVRTQRHVHRWARSYPGLLEPEYVGPVTTAFAFATPWQRSEEIAVPLEFELWIFAVDKAIDTDSRTRTEAEDLAERFIRIAETGVAVGDTCAEQALADIRRHLTRSALWETLGSRWLRLFRDTFRGMITEWVDATRHASGEAVTLDAYLANSDSCAFRLIRLTSWILSAEPAVADHIETLMSAAWQGQVSSRLTNDLATYEREAHDHDLNALKLSSEEVITDNVRAADRELGQLLQPLLADDVKAAIALHRILRFGNGFYETTDFRPPVEVS